MKKILFYSGKWSCFSNFSAFQIDWRGELWPTSEHAYQAAKFDDRSIAEKILKAKSPYNAYRIAHEHEDKMDPDWGNKKLTVMEEILHAKLAQHPVVQDKLQKSLDRDLVEDSPTDGFWGRGPDGNGENHLGKIWMKLRDDLNKEMFIVAMSGPTAA